MLRPTSTETRRADLGRRTAVPHDGGASGDRAIASGGTCSATHPDRPRRGRSGRSAASAVLPASARLEPDLLRAHGRLRHAVPGPRPSEAPRCGRSRGGADEPRPSSGRRASRRCPRRRAARDAGCPRADPARLPLVKRSSCRLLRDARIDGAGVAIRAFDQVAAPVAAFVIRTAQDFAGAGYEAPLAWLDALIGRDGVDLDQLMLLADTLPQTRLRSWSGPPDKVTMRELLGGRSGSLPSVGCATWVAQGEAGRAGEEALLFASWRKAPVQTRSAMCYWPLERGRPAALAPAERSSLQRSQTQAPDAYRPDALALNNLTATVGQREDALAPARRPWRSGASWRPRRPMPTGPISLCLSTTWPPA